MKKERNNKGFSLVELIVVVLIMGIIAVALAPQVMKWVGTARENSDNNQAKTIQSTVQGAVADWQSRNSVPDDADAVYKIGGASSTLDITHDWGASGDLLSTVIDEYMGGDFPKPQTADVFTVTITKGTGKVTVTIGAPAGT